MTAASRALRYLALTATTGMAIVGVSAGYGAPARAARVDVAGIQQTPARTVSADLGADKIPAAWAILVDTSDSMAPPNGLYHEVYTRLPSFLSALAGQDPQDEVAIVDFSSKTDTHTIYPMSSPTRGNPLQRNPQFTLGTDIGYAFQLALADLGADQNAQVGCVLLLSDGGMWVSPQSPDPDYDTYASPGWAKLQQVAQGVGFPVTGYGLPLSSNSGALNQALTAGFGSNVVMLGQSFANLNSELNAAQPKILDKRVAIAAAPDSGRGVRVSWGNGGTVQLNPAAGQAQFPVTFAATTHRVPLAVTNLSVQVAGFPEHVSAKIVPATGVLKPGAPPVTEQVQLSWRPMPGTSAAWSGTMDVRGAVVSPFSNAIRNYYQDAAFTVGGLTGAARVAYQASIPPASYTALIVLVVLIVLVLAFLAWLFYRSRLTGSLILYGTGSQGTPVPLPPRPHYSFTDPINARNHFTVYRNPFKRDRILIKHSKNPKKKFMLQQGGRKMIAGVNIFYRTGEN